MKSYYLLLLSISLLFSCTKEKPFKPVAPPFKAVSIPTDTASFDPSKPKVLNLSGGSSVEVPANAFVDADGNFITEPVTLSCREIKSAADIVVSGIPMTFTDENGEEQQFKSAGMFDIRGTAGGKEIFIAEDKSIKVNFASPVEGDYDLFYLEEEQVKAEAAGIIPAAMAQAPAASLSQARWIRLTDNAEQVPDADDLEQFSLSYDTAQYPEAKALQDISWKIKKGETNNPLVAANKAILEEKWQQVSLSKPEKRINVIKSLPGLKLDVHNNTGNFLVKDSSGFTLFNTEGKKIKSFGGFTKARFMKENFIIFTDNSKNYLVADLTGKEQFKGTDEDVLVSEEGDFVTFRNWSSKREQSSISFRDKSGSVKETLTMPYHFNGRWFYQFVTHNDKYICLTKEDGIYLYTYSGRLLKHLAQPASSSEVLKGNNHVFLKLEAENYKTIPTIWDWKNDQLYKFKDSTDNFYSFDDKGNGLLVLKSNKSTVFWNYLTKFTKTIPASKVSGFTLSNSWFTKVHNEVEGILKTAVYNSEGKEISATIPDLAIGESEGFWFPETTNSIVLKSKSQGFLLIDKDGRILKNLSEIDSSLYMFPWWPVAKNEILGYNRSGTSYIFNAEGDLITKFKPADIPRLILKDTISNTYLVDNKTGALEYSAEGKLLHDLGFIKGMARFPKLTCLGYKDHLEFTNSGTALEAGIYQLNLSSADKSFRTYVYMTDEDLSKFNRYEQKLAETKEKDEHRKEKEYALLRSFEAKKFGVYNYDIKYKNENRIALAADFTFDAGVGNLNITVFQIAGAERNVVIRFDKGSWGEFSYDPTEPTIMIAVLPDDQIAVFDEKDFGNLNTEAIKKEKKYTFKMRTLGKVESAEMLKKLLDKPV